MKNNVIQIAFDPKTVTSIKMTAAALKGLDAVLDSVGQGIREAFSIGGYPDYLQTVKRFGKDLADELLTLQMSFGRLKVAIAQAFAPLAAVVVPYINQAINALIRFAGVVGQFLRGLVAGITGNRAFADSAENAAQAEHSFAAAATAAGKAARRSLMGFDEINRLNAPTGSGGSGGTVTIPALSTEISPQVQSLVDRVMAVLQPILSIDLAPLLAAVQSLWPVIEQALQALGNVLSWLWENILVPFAAWVVEELAPVLVEFFAAKLEAVTAALTPLMQGLAVLWEALKPVVAYIGQTVLEILESWTGKTRALSGTYEEKGPRIVAVFQSLADTVTAVWSRVRPVLDSLKGGTQETFDAMGNAVSTNTGGIRGMLEGLTGFLSGTFAGSWKTVWEGIEGFFQTTVNGIIGLLNGLVSGVVSAINGVVRSVNKLSFTVPDWVPDIGGKKFGFNLKTVSAPQIPYLAQGAVLPANKPFLAVVGDQSHGTNVEAPLGVIQQAVLQALQGQLQEGFAALAAEQRQTRQAISRIRVGDSTIGQAALRYQEGLTMMNGGL